MRTGRIITVMMLAIFPAMAFAQRDSIQTHAFSARQAVDYALKNNVHVKNSLLDIQKQIEVNKEVTSNAYPHINGNLGTAWNPSVATTVLPNFIGPATYQVLIDQGVKDGNGNPIVMPNDFGFIAAQFGTKFNASAGVSLSQILFDGQVFVGLQARGAAIDFYRKGAEVTEELIKTNVYKVYYQLVVARTQVEQLDTNISFLQKNLHDTRIIYENGFREKLDVDRLTVQLTNLQTEKIKLLNTISNGYYGLKILMGMPAKDVLILTDQITDDQIKEGMLATASYKYEDRKEYQFAEIGKKLNEYNVRRYQLSKLPTVSLNANYAKNAQRDKWNFFGKGDWFTVSNVNLNISVPIFNGFFTKSKIAQARIEVQRSVNTIQSLKDSIDADVLKSQNTFRSAIAALDYQKKNIALAETVYQQTKKKYEVGLGSQTDINSAQNDLKTAQSNYVNALYDAIIARIDLLRATGKL